MRHENAVPMDRGVLVELVGDRKSDALAFTQTDERSRQCAVDGDGVPLASVHHPMRTRDCQRDVGA